VLNTGGSEMKKPIKLSIFMLLLLLASTAKAAVSFTSQDYWAAATFKQVEQAIHHGADVSVKGEDGISALMIAVLLNKSPEIIGLLIPTWYGCKCEGQRWCNGLNGSRRIQ